MDKKGEWIDARARAIAREMKPQCDCGGDPNHPGWHHEGCAREAAWDFAMAQAQDEYRERFEEKGAANG